MAAIRVAVALVAFLALMNVASAGTFPYARCNNKTEDSVYSTPSLTINNDGSFCWTIKYDENQCKTDNYCCEAPVRKLQIDTNPACQDGFAGVATISSKKGTSSKDVKITSPPNAAPDETVLTIPDIDLLLKDADGAKVCVKVTKGSCKTFDSLINGDVWKTALWDDNHKCCPITTGDQGCKATITWTGAANQGVSFKNAADQDVASKAIANIIARFKVAKPSAKITDESAVSFSEDKTSIKASIVLTFADAAAGAAFTEWVNTVEQNLAVSPVFGLDPNDPTCGGTKINPSISGTGCSTPSYDIICTLPPPSSPFPFCECEKAPKRSPFQASSFLVEDNNVTFTISAVPMAEVTAPVGSRCYTADELDKAEIWLQYKYRFWIQAVIVTYPSGEVQQRSATWGGKDYPNTFKVTNLGLKYADLADGNVLTIKLVLKADKGGIAEFTADPSGWVWVSLFDASVKCCPTYPLQA